LGKLAIDHLQGIPNEELPLETIGNEKRKILPHADRERRGCTLSSCNYTEQSELARFAKPADTTEESPQPIEKVSTPDCNTIEALANFLVFQRRRPPRH
jgi:prolyl-tRNA synthetase